MAKIFLMRNIGLYLYLGITAPSLNSFLFLMPFKDIYSGKCQVHLQLIKLLKDILLFIYFRFLRQGLAMKPWLASLCWPH
jgi:hypothetical protein